MNFKLLLTTLAMTLFSVIGMQASFPVVKTVTQSQTTETVTSSEEEVLTSPAAAADYNKWIAVALWFFLGGFAAHRWYAGKPTGWNILFIVTFGGLFIWALIDLINILTDNFE